MSAQKSGSSKAPETVSEATESETEQKKDELEGSEATLLEHLTELRARLIYSLVAIAVLFVACFLFSDWIFDFLLQPFKTAAGTSQDVRLIYTAPQEFFFTKLTLSLFGAVFLAFPVVASQIYAFVAPGLYKNERGAFLPYLIATPVFFVLGAAVMFYGVMPLALRFFLSMQSSNGETVSIEMLPRVSEYLSLIMTLILAFGVSFQLPVVLTLLARIGLVSSRNLKSWRKYAIVAVLVVAAFLTPPDPISQMGLALPMLLLYELSIWSVKLVERKRTEREAAEVAQAP